MNPLGCVLGLGCVGLAVGLLVLMWLLCRSVTDEEMLEELKREIVGCEEDGSERS